MNAESKTRMTEGSISRKIIFFAIPLFIGNLFQQLYNTADSLIVGNFLGSNALAAVSSSGNLIFLMVGFINGIALGAGVVIARYYGAKNKEYLQKAIHTTVSFGLAAGLALTAIGMFLAPKILVLMGTPSEVLPQSIEYFRTYFAGSLVYQCGAGYFLYRRPWHGSRGSGAGNGDFPVCQCDFLYDSPDADKRRISVTDQQDRF